MNRQKEVRTRKKKFKTCNKNSFVLVNKGQFGVEERVVVGMCPFESQPEFGGMIS